MFTIMMRELVRNILTGTMAGAAALAIAFSFAGCGPPGPKDSGGASGGSEMPADPAIASLGVPAYPGAALVPGGVEEQAVATGYRSLAVTLFTTDPMDKVVEWYKTELPDHAHSSMDQGGRNIETFFSKTPSPTDMVTVTLESDSRGTMITIVKGQE